MIHNEGSQGGASEFLDCVKRYLFLQWAVKASFGK
jgi:hypothetical protein